MNKYLMIIAPLALAGCYNVPSAQISEAKAKLVRDFYNPAAVKYRDDRVVSTKTGRVLCGEYNSVDADGNYIGFNRYMSVLGSNDVQNEYNFYQADQEVMDLIAWNIPEGANTCQIATLAGKQGLAGQGTVESMCQLHAEIEAAKVGRIAFDAKWNKVCRR